MEVMAFGFSSPGANRLSECFAHFDTPLTDYTVEQVYSEPYFPTTPVEASTKMISYDIPLSPFFTDLSETVIGMASKILLASGANLPPAVKDGYGAAGFAQNPGSSIFKDLHVSLNDVAITSSCNNYSILAYLENLLFYSRETKESKMEASGYYPEAKPSNMNALGLDGFAKRYAKTAESAELELESKLFHGLFQVIREKKKEVFKW